jgi:hypothetical protein
MKLEEALKEAVKLEGKEILTSSRLVPILDDLGAFKDEKCYKNILRTLLCDGYTEDFFSQTVDFQNFVYKVVQNTGIKDIYITKIFEELNNYAKDKHEDVNLSINKGNCVLSEKESKEDNICFLGIPLGDRLDLFEVELLSKGMQRVKTTEDHIVYRGPFLTYEECKILLYITVVTKSVWKVSIHPKNGDGTADDIFINYRAIVNLYQSKYEAIKNCTINRQWHDLYIDWENGYIQVGLNTLQNYSISIDYISKTAKERVKEEISFLQKVNRQKRLIEKQKKKEKTMRAQDIANSRFRESLNDI